MFESAVADEAKMEAKQLKLSLHSLQTQNELLYYQHDGLREALTVKKKYAKKGYTLNLY